MVVEKEYKVDKLIGFNPIVKRTVSYVTGPNGMKFTISKGLVSKVSMVSLSRGSRSF
jgi:hypothetical protein